MFLKIARKNREVQTFQEKKFLNTKIWKAKFGIQNYDEFCFTENRVFMGSEMEKNGQNSIQKLKTKIFESTANFFVWKILVFLRQKLYNNFSLLKTTRIKKALKSFQSKQKNRWKATNLQLSSFSLRWSS